MQDFIQHALFEQADDAEWVVHFANGESSTGVLKHLGEDAYVLGNGSRACYFSSRSVIWVKPKQSDKNGLFDAGSSGALS